MTNTQLAQEENSAFTSLEVYGEDGADVPPEIIVAPKDIRAVKGTSAAELECIANARPLFELELIWLKDDVPIDQAGIPYIFNDPWNRTLSLLQLDFANDGLYTCQVRMKTGGPRLTKEARVTVLEKPHFRTRMASETLGEFGKDIRIDCNIHGVPNPEIKWFRDGIPLSEIPNLRYSTESAGKALKISFLRLEDSGMFQCSSSNEVGDIVGYTWLRVKSK